MIEFKFEDRKVSIPSQWNEVTVEMFTDKDFLNNDGLGLLATLSGIDKDRLANTTENLDRHIGKALTFLRKDPIGWRKGKVKPIEILNTICVIPKNIELERYGQKVMYGQYIIKYKDYSAMPYCVAVYLAPQIYPKDWYNRIDEIAEAIKKLSITTIFPIADFFLSSMTLYLKNGKK